MVNLDAILAWARELPGRLLEPHRRPEPTREGITLAKLGEPAPAPTAEVVMLDLAALRRARPS